MSKNTSSKKETNNSALLKMTQYCAYQERCWQEVRFKMKSILVLSHEVDAIIHYLKENNYVDEARYASAVVRGKFNQKKWGRIKIINELRSKGLEESMINKALEEISAAAYEATILKIFEEKINEYREEQSHLVKDKAIKHLISKGFEYSFIEKTIQKSGVSQLKLF